ncbi:unnamed protein product [Prorocentrum cordatum]|uniref:TIR domain-containing protein n=1 Tax=Prorocentrum cordatum TaxID=2364126 RepID=A0ABN9T647_9DINO|nr:unnamed protein product [Polarella glacialis]
MMKGYSLNMKGVTIPRDRRKELASPLNETEITSLRKATGEISWLESCKCAEGTYLAEGGGLDGPCVDCPDGMQCAFGSGDSNFALDLPHTADPTRGEPAGSTFSNLFAIDGSMKTAADDDQPFPMVEEGYMTRTDDLLRVFKCKTKSHCPGGLPATCARGRDSGEVACARCEDYTYEEGEECHPCQANATWLVLLACFAAVVAVCVGTISVNRNLLMQTSSTLMCVIMASQMFLGLQTFSVFTFFSLEWFEPLRGMLKIMSLISFDLEILRISCSMGSNPTSNYALRQFVAPLAVPWICLTVLVKKQFDPQAMHFREAVNTIGTVFQVFFISIVLSATAPLVFYDHPNDAGSSLVSDPAVLYFESDEHYSMLAVGILAMVLVPLPFLSFVLYGTLKYPNYAVTVGADTNFFGFASFRFLFFRFKPSRYYYGLIMLVRNLLLCLVPVIIESDVAAQVICTSVLILATMVLQVELAPWKLAAANYADAACSSTLLMVLICGAMAANVDVQNSSIPAFASVLVGFFFAVGAVLVAASAFYYFKPFPTYAFFICHHREGAQAQARLLKMILTSKTGQPVLTDTDDLMQLDSLFDTVKTQVHHLVVYLTRDTLSRPWCAGEIVTALMWRRRVTAVVTDSFVPPNDVDYADMAKYLDLSSCSLNAFGITTDSVATAYRSLMSDDVQKVHMRSGVKGMARFEEVTNFLSDCQEVSAASNETEAKASAEALPREPRAVLISSEPGNDEIQPQLKGLVPEGVRVIDEYARDEGAIVNAVAAARALLVLLSPGTLAASEQITAIEQIMLSIEKAGNEGVPPPAAVSVAWGFQVPSDEYYNEKIRRVSQGGQKSAALIRSFFQQGAVQFSVGASEQILEAQVSELVLRVSRAEAQEGPKEQAEHGAEGEHSAQGQGGGTAAGGEDEPADDAPQGAGPPAGPQQEAGQGGDDNASLQV